MIRFTAALAAGLVSAVTAGGVCSAADLGPYRAPQAAPVGRSAVVAGARVVRPEYSYYGEYGYPVPFGYGYAYAPTPGRNMEYGYYGPTYYVFAPDTYRGPIFGYHEW
ncbi:MULTISPECIES: hypothetical protein [Methylobacterium]|jgi:hypothetical protein|uniref:Uncharacterized protein n=1 Tax=Methylobacterium brachiatum TaxID=269660 RepID=A0ABV1R6X2_9HYPH|nr:MULTISPECIES: hypothetical protein [Methylobacterium]AYO85503.1 hypothetical protein EBB05_26915 [Methylobacterium brachiatum]EIZ81547.1 putative signal peptide protein [Methylobacterium sp. GXF4]MDF2602000.1 hypothetical protein [Methylobacterium brachiatum]